MIAGTNSEEELALLLAENTAHIVLEDNLASENHTFRSCGEYGLITSSVVRDCAWDEYFRGNYEISEELIDKLINLGISDEEDWLLKTKNLLALKNNYESNLLALEYIEAAQQIDQYHLAEVLLVKGIILMRLERTEEAREVLNEFIEASEYAGIDESQIEEAKKMIADCDNFIMNR
jgi:tetratricopeptide (TPR) repeat protein